MRALYSHNKRIDNNMEVVSIVVVARCSIFMVVFATMQNFWKKQKFCIWRGFAALKDSGIYEHLRCFIMAVIADEKKRQRWTVQGSRTKGEKRIASNEWRIFNVYACYLICENNVNREKRWVLYIVIFFFVVLYVVD